MSLLFILWPNPSEYADNGKKKRRKYNIKNARIVFPHFFEENNLFITQIYTKSSGILDCKMRRGIFFGMAFIGSFAGNIIKVETAAKAYLDISSVFFLALFTAGFMIGRAISAILGGKIFDRYPMYARRIMVISFVLLGLLCPAYLFVSVYLYLFLRFVSGLLSGFAWPVVQSMLLTSSSYSEKSKNMSIYFIFGSVGMSTAFLVFIYLEITIITIIGLSLFLLTALLGSFIKIEIKRGRVQKENKSNGNIDKKTKLKYIVLASELGLVTAIIATDTITAILLDKGFNKIELGFILSMSSYIGIVIGMFSSYIIASIADRYGERNTIIALSILMMASTISLLLSSSIATIITSLTLLRIFVYCYRPVLVALAKSDKTTGLNVGIINASHNAATVVFSPVIGTLIESEAINILTLIILIVALLTIIIARRK